MIDGITYYERQPKRRNFVDAIESIMNIMEDRDDLIVKLLLTCHGRSIFVKNLVDDDDILLVSSTIDGDGQLWSNLKWDRVMGAEIEELGDDISDADSDE